MARRKIGDGLTHKLPGRPVVAGYGADPEGRCARCWLQPRHCICASLPSYASPLPVVVVRHYKESLHSSNSARLVPLVLTGARVLDVSQPQGPHATEREVVSLPEGAALLYPPREGEESVPLSQVRALVVPDGTWAQTRRLVRRLEPLPSLPRLQVSAPPDWTPPERLLTPHEPWAVSTLEAIGLALLTFGYAEEGRAALEAYSLFVAAAARQRGLPRASLPGEIRG